MILISMMTFGNLYSLDNVATIKADLFHYFMEQNVHFTNKEYAVGIYSTFYLPNCFMPFLTGIVIDKYGLRYAVVVLGIISIFGGIL